MKPFPFAIWPNFIKKGMEEDLRPLVDKLNSGPVRVAHENWPSAKVAQHLSEMQTQNEQKDAASKKQALVAFRHRLKNIHGVDISRPGLLQVPDSVQSDMGTLSSLARIGGAKLAQNKPVSGAAYGGSDLYMHGTRSKKFLQSGGILDPKFLFTTIGTGGHGLYVENVTEGRSPPYATESPGFTTEGAFGFRMNPKARIVSYNYPFSEDERQKLSEFFDEFPGRIDMTKIATPSQLARAANAGAKGLGSLALATIGIDAIKNVGNDNSEEQNGRTIVLPHAVHNMGVIGKYYIHPENSDLEQLAKPVTFTNKKPPPFAGAVSFLQQVAPRLFPALAANDTQNGSHQGNSVLEHTALGLKHLDIDSSNDRMNQLLKLAWSLHDVGKTEDATDEDHPRKSVAVAKQYLDAQQRGAFQLTDDERNLVEHLMTWHDAFGHVLGQLLNQQNLNRTQPADERDKISDADKKMFESKIHGIMNGDAPSSTDTVHSTKDIFTNHIVTDLLSKMWIADIESTPGLMNSDGTNVFGSQHGYNHTTRFQAKFVKTLIEKALDTWWYQNQQGQKLQKSFFQLHTPLKNTKPFPFAIWPQGLRK